MSGAVAALLIASRAFSGPVVRTYDSGSGTETVPNGAQTLVIEAWGGGGNGGGSGSTDSGRGGGGGGGGAYCRKTLSLNGGQNGRTLNYTVGGNSTVTNNSVTIPVNMTANRGGNGVSGTTGSPGSGGNGGTAVGGDVNTSGGFGTPDGGDGGSSPNGGSGGGPSENGSPPGGGGGGAQTSFDVIGTGASGRVRFTYT